MQLWQIKYFWSHTYFDFIPLLLEDYMLPTSIESQEYATFVQELYQPEATKISLFGAHKAINRFPCCPHLLLEIAKVCFARKMFYEADFIISKILIIDQDHITARIMRMIIFCNIGASQNSLQTAEMLFEQAINEGTYCVKQFAHEQEVWNELGLVYITISMQYLRYKRTGSNDTIQDLQNKTVDYLASAENFFSTAATVSPTGKGNRSIYWLLYTKSIRKMLKDDSSIFSISDNQSLQDNNNSFFSIGLSFFTSLGWISLPKNYSVEKTPLPESELQKLLFVLDCAIKQFDTSVLSRNFTPNIKFSFCGLLWDFYPELTEPVCRQILTWIDQAESAANRCIHDTISVYSSTGAMALLQDPTEFIQNVSKAKDKVIKMLKLISQQAQEPNDKTISEIANLRKSKFIMMFTDTL